MTELPITAVGAIGLVSKATVVLSVALVLAWFARRGSPRTLHLLWNTTFAVLLVSPVLILLAPSWSLPILPARTTAVEHRLPNQTANAPSTTANLPVVAGSWSDPATRSPTTYVSSRPHVNGSIPLTPAAGVFLIWALGCGAGLISLGTAALRFRKLVRGATPIRDPDWIRSTIALRHRLRVRADPRILSSSQVHTPMTGGPLRPVILLPASAESWTPDRREMVVSHELVHVRRWDALWRLVGGAAVALYWFHPLIWLASRLAGTARERSCDEEVLELGELRPSEYARHLFSLASEITPGPTVLSLQVVQPPHLESRIMSILKSHRPRFSRIRTYAALAIVGLVGTVAACARPVSMDPAASPASQAEAARLDEGPAENPEPPGNPAPVSAESSDRMPAERLATASNAPSPLPAPEALGLQEIECEPRSFTGIMRDGESTTVRVSVAGMSLCMRTRGDVVMTEDGTAVASIGPGSWLVLASRAERLHRMAVTSGPSGLEYEWSIDGRSQPFDDEARDWRDLMLTVLSRSQEAWEVRGKEGRLRGEIASHKGRVAVLRGRMASHKGQVAVLRGQMASHKGQVAVLRGKIASHRGHVASQRGEVARHELSIADLRRAMARITSADTQEALREATRALEQQSDEMRREIERYDLDGKVRDIEAQIEEYDLAGRIRDIEAQIGEYDLDRKVSEMEAQIEEWDADSRAEEIERSIQDDITSLRRLIHALERSR